VRLLIVASFVGAVASLYLAFAALGMREPGDEEYAQATMRWAFRCLAPLFVLLGRMIGEPRRNPQHPEEIPSRLA
jgi:hypothetical protein